LSGSPSQLPKLPLHDGTHVPLEQLVVPLAAVHTWLHTPQCDVDARFPSHPSVTSPLQSSKPTLHVMLHVLLVHDAVPFVPLHAWLQPPQCATVFVVFTSQPFEVLPSQFSKPALHVPIVHTPVEHDSLAFVKLHGTPQPPQFDSVVRLVSQPSAAPPPQLPKFALQAPIWHTPPKHDAAAFAKLHGLLHALQ
jgi:hypothetical protein